MIPDLTFWALVKEPVRKYVKPWGIPVLTDRWHRPPRIELLAGAVAQCHASRCFPPIACAKQK